MRIRLAPALFFGSYLTVFTVCAIAPYDRAVWWAENLPILLLVGAVALVGRKHRFSAASYMLMSFLVLMHTVGGHYTFERVPFDWFTDAFGFERNHYDRIAHFTVGFYAFPLAEIMESRSVARSRWLVYVLPLFTIMSVAALYELFEWGYAVMGDPEAGHAVLGSQGNPWDAQKDMLADTLGALTALGIFWFRPRVWRVAGFLFMILAVIGFLLPLIPGFPFMLLAMACFGKPDKRHRQDSIG